MEVDEILDACLVIDRRRPGTNEFGEEIPEIDVDIMRYRTIARKSS